MSFQNELEATYEKGIELLNAGNVHESIPFLAKAADQNRSYKTLNILASAFMRINKYNEALTCFNKIDANGWTNAKSLLRKSQAQERLDHISDAMETYRKLLALDPMHVPSTLRYCEFLWNIEPNAVLGQLIPAVVEIDSLLGIPHGAMM